MWGTHGSSDLELVGCDGVDVEPGEGLVADLLCRRPFVALKIKWSKSFLKIQKSEWDLFKRISQTQFAGFSNKIIMRKIDKNQRKNIEITKKGVFWRKNVKINIPH